MGAGEGTPNLYVLSDLHVGDGTGADRFLYADVLTALLNRIDKEPTAELLLLGDIFELWSCELEPVLVAHMPLVRQLLQVAARHRIHYVVGNHDALPLYVYIGLVWGNLSITERFITADGKFVALHGHQFDPYNQIKAGELDIQTPVSARLTRAIGVLERLLGARVGDVAATIGDLVEHSSTALGHLKDLHRQETPGQRGYPKGEDPYRRGAQELMRQGARYVLMGHTHHPERVSMGAGRVYVNTGSWCWDRYPPTYAHFDGRRLRLLNARTELEYVPEPTT